MWLGGEDQETWLGYKGLNCKCEGQARGSGVMDRHGSEQWWIQPHNGGRANLNTKEHNKQNFLSM